MNMQSKNYDGIGAAALLFLSTLMVIACLSDVLPARPDNTAVIAQGQGHSVQVTQKSAANTHG